MIDIVGSLKNFSCQLFPVFCGVVGHFDVFRVMPTGFHRVQFRRIRWKEEELKPMRMFLLHDRSGGMMSRKIVPNNHDLAAVITMNFVQPIKAFRSIDPPGKQGQTKSKIKASRRDREKSESRERRFPGSFDQGRRPADRCPGGTAMGRK